MESLSLNRGLPQCHSRVDLWLGSSPPWGIPLEQTAVGSLAGGFMEQT